MHIENLYRNTDILLFKRGFSLEKLDGTSSHISFINNKLEFFSGGSPHQLFLTLFDREKLIDKFISKFGNSGIEKKITIFGEAIGGKIQKMSKTYGPNLMFVAFDVKIGDTWLNTISAERLVQYLELPFVYYEEIDFTIEELDRCRSKNSEQAIRNGMGNNHMQEGVVLRPLKEFMTCQGRRLITKYKNENFRETKTIRKIDDPEALKILEDATAIAEEWCVAHRLEHVLQKIEKPSMEKMRDIIIAMQLDIQREAEGEIVWNDSVCKAIGKQTAYLVKQYFQNQLKE